MHDVDHDVEEGRRIEALREAKIEAAAHQPTAAALEVGGGMSASRTVLRALNRTKNMDTLESDGGDDRTVGEVLVSGAVMLLLDGDSTSRARFVRIRTVYDTVQNSTRLVWNRARCVGGHTEECTHESRESCEGLCGNIAVDDIVSVDSVILDGSSEQPEGDPEGDGTQYLYQFRVVYWCNDPRQKTDVVDGDVCWQGALLLEAPSIHIKRRWVAGLRKIGRCYRLGLPV